MKRFFTLVLLLFSQTLHCQTLKGIVLSRQNDQPIPYANLGLIGTTFGTSANENGEFIVGWEDSSTSDSIMFSAVGFSKATFPVNQLLSEKHTIIYLEEKITQLDNVVVINKKLKEIVRGKTSTGNGLGRMIGENLGAQFARKIPVKGKKSHIRDVSFFVSCPRDSVKLRLRIYSFENEIQGEDLLNTNIFVHVGQAHGWQTVNISKYNIWTDQDFIIGFEWLANDFSYPLIGIGGLSKNSYSRLASHGRWNQIMNMNWAINTTLWTE